MRMPMHDMEYKDHMQAMKMNQICAKFVAIDNSDLLSFYKFFLSFVMFYFNYCDAFYF